VATRIVLINAPWEFMKTAHGPAPPGHEPLDVKLLRAIATVGNDVVLTDCLGATTAYSGVASMTAGDFYTPPDGVLNSIMKTATGYAEIRPESTTFLYDSSGELERVQAIGGTWTLSRSSGRLETIEDPTGGVTTFQFDVNDKIEKIIDPGGRETLFTVDGATGDLTSITSPELCIASLSYGGEKGDVRCFHGKLGKLAKF
jgi:uncharacterized protein RhaS with RHS repeats